MGCGSSKEAGVAEESSRESDLSSASQQRDLAHLFAKVKGSDETVLGKELFSFCKDQFKVAPDFTTKICESYKSVPSIQSVFFTDSPSVSTYTLDGDDFTNSLEVLASGCVASVVGKNSHFNNVAGATSNVQAWLDDSIWSFIEYDPLNIDPKWNHWINVDVQVDKNTFCNKWNLQYILDAMKTGTAASFFKDLTPEDWRRGVIGLWRIVDGKSIWIIPAAFEQGQDDLPLMMMIAISKHFAPDEWSTMQGAVQNAFPSASASNYLSVANNTYTGFSQILTVDTLVNGCSSQLGGDIDAKCNNDVQTFTAWESDGKFVPETGYVYSKDRRERTDTYGQFVQQWVTDHQSNTLYFMTGLGSFNNYTVTTEYRPHGGVGGSCFIKGTTVLCLNQHGNAILKKEVENVMPGDHVISQNGTVSVVSDEKVYYPVMDVELVGFIFDDGEVLEPFMTKGHPLWTHNAGWCCVSPEEASMENGFCQAKPLHGGQGIYTVSSCSVRASFDVEVELVPRRIAKITTATRKTAVCGLHFRSGLRSYFAGGVLVGLNYPEITLSRIMHGVRNLSPAQHAEMAPQLGKVSDMIAKGTRCSSIGHVFKTGVVKMHYENSHNPKNTSGQCLAPHQFQGEYVLRRKKDDTLQKLTVHRGHVTLHEPGQTFKYPAGIRHWTEAQQLRGGSVADEVLFTRDGGLHAKFPTTTLRCASLLPFGPSLAVMQDDKGVKTSCTVSAISNFSGVDQYSQSYNITYKGGDKPFAEITFDSAMYTVTIKSLFPFMSPIWMPVMQKRDPSYSISVCSQMPISPAMGAYNKLDLAFSSDFSRMTGSLSIQNDKTGKTLACSGVLAYSRPAPSFLMKSPPAITKQPLTSAALRPAWGLDLPGDDPPMSAVLLARLPPPNKDELTSNIMTDIMNSACALYPDDKLKQLKMLNFKAGKSVPPYLAGQLTSDQKTLLISIVTAQLSSATYDTSTTDQWNVTVNSKLQLEQRVQYYLQGNGEKCMSSSKHFSEVFDMCRDWHYPRLEPGMKPYMDGQGGKTKYQWATELFKYVSDQNVLMGIIFADPNSGDGPDKYTQMFKILTAGATDPKVSSLPKKWAELVSRSTFNFIRRIAGSFSQEEMEDVILRIFQAVWKYSENAKADPEVAKAIKAAMEELDVIHYSKLAATLSNLIKSMASWWYKKAGGSGPQPEPPSEVIAEWMKDMQSKQGALASKLCMTVFHTFTFVAAGFALFYTIENWSTLDTMNKISMVTSNVWTVLSITKTCNGWWDKLTKVEQLEPEFEEEASIYMTGLDDEDMFQSFYSCISEVDSDGVPLVFESFVDAVSDAAADAAKVPGSAASRWKTMFNFATSNFLTILLSVVDVLAIGVLIDMITGDLKKDHAAWLVTMDSIMILTTVIDLGLNITVMYIGAEAAAEVAIVGLSIPVFGQVIALVGIVAGIIRAIIISHELTPLQQWVKDTGVPLIQSVPDPTPKWLSDHAVPGSGSEVSSKLATEGSLKRPVVTVIDAHSTNSACCTPSFLRGL